MSLLDKLFSAKTQMPTPETALPGRDTPLQTDTHHVVSGNPLKGPYPDGFQTAVFGMGCFWGVERIFWQISGVWVTAVGYSGGITPNPTYEETCTGRTGQTEVVQVVFDPSVVTYGDLLKAFWENHDPTQGMRQGNDVGTTYRSAIYYVDDTQKTKAEASRDAYQGALDAAGRGRITTEIAALGPFYYAEGYHQGYLAKNPGGYCGIGGTGVTCPVGVGVAA
jgi:peptide-methionine (S)-S-oxide reductase